MSIIKKIKTKFQFSSKKDEKYLEKKRSKKLAKHLDIIIKHQTQHMIQIEAVTKRSLSTRPKSTPRKSEMRKSLPLEKTYVLCLL
jgi:hypothetical protein